MDTSCVKQSDKPKYAAHEKSFKKNTDNIITTTRLIRCACIRRRRVKEIQTSSQNRKCRQVITTSSRAQIVTAKTVWNFCSEVRSVFVDSNSSSSSDVLSG